MSEAGSLIRRLMASVTGATLDMTRSKDARRADRLARVLRTLISEKGEATGAALARRSLTMYAHLGPEGRQRFF